MDYLDGVYDKGYCELFQSQHPRHYLASFVWNSGTLKDFGRFLMGMPKVDALTIVWMGNE